MEVTSLKLINRLSKTHKHSDRNKIKCSKTSNGLFIVGIQ